MTRLKFLVFALPALALLAYLVYVSPGVAARTADQAAIGLAGAPAAVALRLEEQRSDLQSALIRLAASPAALNPGPKSATGKLEAPNADRFGAVRTVLLDGLPEAHKPTIAIALINEAGSLFAQGSGDPGPAPEGVDVAALAAAALPGGGGTIGSLNGAPTLFYATPLLISDRNEVKVAGSVLVGLPLIPDAKALAEVVARDLKLEAVGIASSGAMLGAAGPQKALADKALKTVKANGTQALEQSPVESLGPIKLPMMLASPMALETGIRREITGTPYEVVAVASSRASVEALASFQSYAISILMALSLLSIAVLVLLGSGDDEGVRMSMPPPLPIPPISRPTAEPISSLTAAAPPAEASPDDFDFPSTGSGQLAAISSGIQPAISSGIQPALNPALGADDESSDPFAKQAPAPSAPPYPPQNNVTTAQQPLFVPSGSSASQPFFTPPPPVSSSARAPSTINPFDDSEEADRTVAYPMARASSPNAAPVAMDPFALASAQSSDHNYDSNNDNDSTRVAAVPKELIQAARGGTGGTGDQPMLRVPAGAMPKVQSVAATDEEKHFQEVFRDFIATRERCGEAADGLTYEKFKTKLLKNKEALVAKYNCRTVRFQVYVKDGKAALKATPVKD